MFFAIIWPCLSFAQFLPIVQEKSSKETFESAKSLYDFKQFKDALPQFLVLLSEDPDNSNLNYLMGDCYLNIEGSELEAIPYLKKAIKNTTGDYFNSVSQRKAPMYAYVKLGDLYYSDYKFDDAVINYKIFNSNIDVKKDKLLYDEVKKKIDITSSALNLFESPVKVGFTEIPFINIVAFSNYSAQATQDGNFLYFSRRRLGNTGVGTSDIFIMKKTDGKWGRHVRMPFINSDADDTFCCVSKDGNTMYFASNRDGKFHIYFTQKRGKTQWSEPEMVDSPINTPKSEETFAAISPDDRSLFFVSDRKGGFGGKDIYRSNRPPGGNWGPAENLGATINTSSDEESVSISPDGKMLYFSSKGLKGMGGYDVFVSSNQNNNIWGTPVNIGYPINTTGDDMYFSRSFSNTEEYFVSRSKVNKNDFTVSIVNESGTVANTSNDDASKKAKQKEKPKLKLVPKTLKY